MKNLIFLSSVLLSLNAMAGQNLKGKYAGQDCSLTIDFLQDGQPLSEVSAGEINCYLYTIKESRKTLKFKGSNEIEYCKVSVKMDTEGKPSSYKLKTRAIFSPFYTTKATCLDLKKI